MNDNDELDEVENHLAKALVKLLFARGYKNSRIIVKDTAVIIIASEKKDMFELIKMTNNLWREEDE